MWQYYEFFAIGGILFLVMTAFSAIVKHQENFKKTSIFSLLAIGAIGTFILLLWLDLERAPMRTLGETRLWYSFFLILIGFFIYRRFKYNWLLIYTAFLSSLFLLLNYVKPEVQSKTLMPALQSFWFVPHVIVYMIGYAFLGMSALIGIWGIYQMKKLKPIDSLIKFADRVVLIGFSFLNLGLVFGALWAKEAWGHYWTWDPKETWALLSWLVYLVYIHFRKNKPDKSKLHLILLFVGFIVIILCWFGIKYIPAAANSVHVYS